MVRWVAEDKRPFSIVADKRFRVLMKTGPGRHGQYVPSPATVGRDVRKVFTATRSRIAAMLQVSHTYEAILSIETYDLERTTMVVSAWPQTHGPAPTRSPTWRSRSISSRKEVQHQWCWTWWSYQRDIQGIT